MIFFRSDYSAGAHPEILKALEETNFQHTDGYGEDKFCYGAAKIIKEKVGREDVDVHFLVGGTQTNLTAISAFLRPYEAAVSAKRATPVLRAGFTEVLVTGILIK